MSLNHLLVLLRRPRSFDAASSGHGDTAGRWDFDSTQTLPALDPLEIQTAIIEHLEWCMLFNEHLGADPEMPHPLQPLADATDSGLGRWIAKLQQNPELQHPLLDELAQENRRFHRLAHQALDFARSQRMDLASTLLNMEFERSRARVLEILRWLQKA